MKRLEETLLLTAMVEEIALCDGWKKLDACYENRPKHVELYFSYAEAALRGLRRHESAPLPYTGPILVE